MPSNSRDIDPFWAICGQVVVAVNGVSAVAVPGEYVQIEGFEDYQFMLLRNFVFSWSNRIMVDARDGYVVSEALTGFSVAHGATREEAMAIAGERLQGKGPERLAEVIAESPKLWTGMQCHYADPRDSWKVLLYNGISHPKEQDA